MIGEPLDRSTERRLRELLAAADAEDDPIVGLKSVMSAMAYWRERCEVGLGDVAREGVTVAKRTAWLRSVAEPKTWRTWTEWRVDGHFLTETNDDHQDDDAFTRKSTARVIRDVAPKFGLSPWAVLHAMAEIEL